jgi:hypothetical protein
VTGRKAEKTENPKAGNLAKILKTKTRKRSIMKI